jgi:Zn-dependent protease
MYGERPPGVQGEYQAPAPFQQPRGGSNKGWGKAAGGTAVGLGFLALKFKTLLLVLFSFKWFFIAGKLALSFGSLFVSIWFWAIYFGWNLAVVFMLLVLVHEMGHWFTLRAFGIPVSLPYFIPGLGAFVNAKTMPEDSAQYAASALAGPVVGIIASAMCQFYGIQTGSTFWIVAAHLGYFINAFNLIPVLPLDGGRVAHTIDPRLWMLGVLLFLGYMVMSGSLMHSLFSWLIVALILGTSWRRAIDAWRGTVDPRILQTPPKVRAIIAVCYFATIVAAAAGAITTNVPRP